MNGCAGRALVLAAALTTASAAAHPPVILNYHRIEVPALVTYVPTTAGLADQVRHLQALGYRFVTSSELVRALAAGETDALAALTFDDGDASVLRALPLLEALGAPATVFVIGDRIGAPGSLNAADLRTLLAAGWEIGNHGHTHARLTELTPNGLARELDAAIAAIERAVGAAPNCLAYAFGLHDARVRAAVAARHACAFTTGPGHATVGGDALALPRPPVSPLDATDPSWRVEAGGSALGLALAAAATVWVLEPPIAASSPRVAWAPTGWLSVGDGALELDVHGGTLTQAFTVRDGPWALHALQARGARPAGAFALARALPGATAAVVWTADDGWGAGAAVDLAGYGEAWAWWTSAAGWRLGVDAILADGVRARGAWRPTDGALDAEIRAALPLAPGEGRPLAILAGVRSEGAASAAHLGAALRVGAHEGALRVDARGHVGAAITVRW